MTEQEKKIRIELLTQELCRRAYRPTEQPVCGCYHPLVVHHLYKGHLRCYVDDCECSDFMLKRKVESVELATDLLFFALRVYRQDRSTDSLANVVKAAQLCEELQFRPVVLKHRRAIQVCSTLVQWEGERPWMPYVPPSGTATNPAKEVK